MPVTKTATRALRKSKIKEKQNKIIKNKVKDVIREVKKTSSGKSSKDIKELTQKAYKE